MHRFLSKLPRPRRGEGRTRHRTAPELCRLEDRIALASNLFVTSAAATTASSFVRELDGNNLSLVRSLAVPASSDGPARDLVVAGGKVHAFNGTFAPQLSTYDIGTNAWSQAGAPGWSTVNNVSYGGIAIAPADSGGYVYVTDMATADGPERGVLRFNPSDGTSVRFATDTDPIDVAVGPGGQVYTLDANRTVRIYRPDLLAQFDQIVLPPTITVAGVGAVAQDYRALAVDTQGQIFTADWNKTLARFDRFGQPKAATIAGRFSNVQIGNLIDIDYDASRSRVVAGSTNGVVSESHSSFDNLRTFGVGTGPVFVAYSDPLVGVRIDGATVTEGDPTARFTVSLSRPSGVPVTLNYNTLPNSTLPDITPVQGPITFNPGETVKFIDVPIVDDADDELTEYFYISLYDIAGATYETLTGVGTILDNDPPPSQSPYAPVSAAVARDDQGDGIFEGLSSAASTIQISRGVSSGSTAPDIRGVLEFPKGGADPATAGVITLDVYVEPTSSNVASTINVYGYSGDGTADGADAARTGTLLGSFNASGTTGWRRVTLNRDAVASILSQGSHLGIVLAGPAGASTAASLAGTNTQNAPRLNYWSSAPPIVPTVSVTNAGFYLEGNPGTAATNVSFTISLSQASTAYVAVPYRTVDGSAVAGSDYVNTVGQVIFAPGETSKTVTVTIIGDTLHELGETFYLMLTGANVAAIGTSTGYATISNDDAAPTISIGDATVKESDPGAASQATFTVTLSNATYIPVTVYYSTANGTAVTGSDFTGITDASVVFNPGETQKTFTVTILGDTLFEPTEVFSIIVTGWAGPSGASIADGTGVGTVFDNDPKPTIRAANTRLTEGNAGTATLDFFVNLAAASHETITVDFATEDGTATAGIDYAATAGSLTFAPGETRKVVSVTVIADSLHEADETVLLRLSNAVNATLVAAPGTGIIFNDDARPAVNLSPATGRESDGSLAFTITLDAPSGVPITAYLTTSDGGASAGVDYAALSSYPVTFAPGETRKTVSVTLLDDRVHEPTETFTLTARDGFGGLLAGALGTIDDDDPLPTIGIGDASAAEGDANGGEVVFILTLSAPLGTPVSVDYATADGTATAGADYTAAGGTVTFAPGQTVASVRVAVRGETLLEGTETFTLRLSNAVGASIAAASAVGTILDDDFAPVAVAGPDVTAGEGGVVSFGAAGSSDADGDPLTYSWDFGDGTTGAGVAPTHVYADDGTYTVTLTVGDGQGGVSTDTLAVTVLGIAPTASVAGPATGVRGQSRTFTFSASDPSAADRAGVFTYRIAWGDGTTETVTGPASGVAVAHVYTTAATRTVSVTATDPDGAEGPPATFAIAIKAAEVQGGDLVVGGTTGAERITLVPTNTSGGVRVLVGGADVGTFTPSGQVVVFAQAGNDTVDFQTARFGKANVAVSRPLALFGGEGNDTLDARNATGAAVLLGGAGDDTLYGGTGRSILIGGMGSDTLRGGSDEDILIGGTTAHDLNLAAIAALRAEWSRTNADYSTRRAHLLGQGPGLNGAYLLDPASVDNDGVLDDLFGNGGRDWFFQSAGDRLDDRKNNEALSND